MFDDISVSGSTQLAIMISECQVQYRILVCIYLVLEIFKTHCPSVSERSESKVSLTETQHTSEVLSWKTDEST